MAIDLDKIGRGEYNPNGYGFEKSQVDCLLKRLPKRTKDGKPVYLLSDLDEFLRKNPDLSDAEVAIAAGMRRSVRGQHKPTTGISYGKARRQPATDVTFLR